MALLMVAMTACADARREAAPAEEANQGGRRPAEETAGTESLLGTEPVTITFWHSASR